VEQLGPLQVPQLTDGYSGRLRVSHRKALSLSRLGIVTEQEAQEMVELAKLIRQQVEEWIRNNHPELAREI